MIHHFDFATPIEETLRALDDIARAGKIRYIGCSNFAAWQAMKALGISAREHLLRFEMIEAQWSLATRELEREIVPFALDQGVGLMLWGPLLGGLLTGKYDRDGKEAVAGRMGGKVPEVLSRDHVFNVVDAMRPVAKAHNVPVSDVAIAWLLHQKATTSVIVGATRPEQVEANVKAIDLKLTSDDLAALDKASAIAPDYGLWVTRMVRGERQKYA